MPPMVIASFLTHVLNTVLSGQSPLNLGFAFVSTNLVQLLTFAGLL